MLRWVRARHDSGTDLRRPGPGPDRGRIGDRPRSLTPAKRREIAESVLSGHKSAAEMARLYDISQPTVSRNVAEYRQEPMT
ncbi:helix-turn-helix domain-containing protein [Mycobacterium sp. KBS0706]|uniref:helix-turn-helix domain-containing protein n=1 Tax=Mycobacterium sp. KBS0706 TaxID=2578109 RepID=UPI0035A05F49